MVHVIAVEFKFFRSLCIFRLDDSIASLKKAKERKPKGNFAKSRLATITWPINDQKSIMTEIKIFSINSFDIQKDEVISNYKSKVIEVAHASWLKWEVVDPINLNELEEQNQYYNSYYPLRVNQCQINCNYVILFPILAFLRIF